MLSDSEVLKNRLTRSAASRRYKLGPPKDPEAPGQATEEEANLFVDAFQIRSAPAGPPFRVQTIVG